jgi:hypothetical protein
MDNFDLKKYLAEGWLNGKKGDEVIHGTLDLDKHTEDNPLVLKSYTNKGLYKMVRIFAKTVARIYALNLTSAISDIKDELDKLDDREG